MADSTDINVFFLIFTDKAIKMAILSVSDWVLRAVG